MGDKTKIEWTDATWTPIRARLINRAAAISKPVGSVGWHCVHVSEGCRNCYAEGMNKRLGTGLEYKPSHLLRSSPDIEVLLDEEMLLKPLRWKKPRKVFVCSMTDLFADFVRVEWIDRMFAVMALCPQHTFQALTKRPERMREYCSSLGRHHETDRVSLAMKQIHAETGHGAKGGAYTLGPNGWHFDNIWLGTSCEDQATADVRVPQLLATPAAVRFLSCEPLLGPIDLNSTKGGTLWIGGQRGHDGQHRGTGEPGCPRTLHHHHDERCGPGIDWVICGGESGPRARPMHPDWARSLRSQCAAAQVPFHFKQWGEFGRVGDQHPCPDHLLEDADTMTRVGKKRAGRKLDGVEHNDAPGILK